jgi:hypothetical protein
MSRYQMISSINDTAKLRGSPPLQPSLIPSSVFLILHWSSHRPLPAFKNYWWYADALGKGL